MSLLVFDDLDSFEVFCSGRMTLNWDLADVILMIKLGLCGLGRKHPEVKCCVHHIPSKVYAIN